MQTARADGASSRRTYDLDHGERVEVRARTEPKPAKSDVATTRDASPTSTDTAPRPRPTLRTSLDARARFDHETGADDLAHRLQTRFTADGPALATNVPTGRVAGRVDGRVAGAGATAPRTADVASIAQAAPVAQVGDAEYQEALENQRALSEARQELGTAQLELEGRSFLQRGWDFVTGGDDDKEQRIEELKQGVADLEAEETKLSPDAVAQARLTVFEERLAAVEQAEGKGEAARLARQTYYNSDVWNGAAGTDKASEGEINAAGFPRGAWHSGAATDGFDGEMQTRDGTVVDMGHVACALDWQVNGRGGFPNPFDANAVTLTGDLASAILRTPTGGDPAAAIGAEGDADWNGDLDGNNLAKRLADDPNASLADTVSSYYSGDYQGRIDEWATHSKYVVRGDDDVPLRDADGHYVLDRDQLQRDANGFAVLLSQGATLNPMNRFEDRAVIDAWADWFESQPQSSK